MGLYPGGQKMPLRSVLEGGGNLAARGDRRDSPSFASGRCERPFCFAGIDGVAFLAWIYNLAHRLRVLNATEGGERRKKPILRFSSGISRLPARSGVTPHECSAGVRFPNPKAKFLTCVKGSFCTTKVKAASNRESTTSQIIKSSFPHSRCLHRNHPAT